MKINKAEIQPIIDGDVWLSEMVQGHNFHKEKSPHHVNVLNKTVRESVRIKLGKRAEIIDVPAGSMVTFYRTYPLKTSADISAAIFLEDEQVTVRGTGSIVRRRHNG